MNEPDSTPRRRPPTIDLTAKEVEAEQQSGATGNSAAAGAAKEAAAEQGERGERTPRNRSYVVGAAIGAVAVAAIATGLWLAGLAPARHVAATPASTMPPGVSAAKIADADEISSRLAKIQEALQAPRSDESLAARLAAADAQTKSLGDQLAALGRRVDELAAAAQSSGAQAKAATAALDAAKSAAQTSLQRGDLDALDNRLAALESAVKSLAAEVAQRTASADDRAARAAIAAEALRAAVERGAPYPAELAAMTALGADRNALAALTPFAAAGVPSAAELARELASLTPSLQQASGTATDEGSFLARLQRHAQRLVRITPIDAAAAPAPAADDPSSVVARLNGDAARGDVPGALADIGRLPDAVRARADEWVKKAEARERAVAASRRIAADALAALARPASQ
jgi:hypothetical protein